MMGALQGQPMPLDTDQRMHHLMDAAGIRAPMTAAALLQLIAELRRSGVLNDPAVERIKDAVAREAFQVRPSHCSKREFEADIRAQMDRMLNAASEFCQIESNDLNLSN
jgi:hypothetical protein